MLVACWFLLFSGEQLQNTGNNKTKYGCLPDADRTSLLPAERAYRRGGDQAGSSQPGKHKRSHCQKLFANPSKYRS